MRIKFNNDDSSVIVTLSKREDLYLTGNPVIDRLDENNYRLRNDRGAVIGFLINGTQIERIEIKPANKMVSRVKYGPIPVDETPQQEQAQQ